MQFVRRSGPVKMGCLEREKKSQRREVGLVEPDREKSGGLPSSSWALERRKVIG